LALEAELQGACGKTRDFKEGVLAFLEKRPARFEGR
jgi:2-(1,2-epoxy-1,2-dihydrophenyl)acetyl-CoA isomerase